MKIRLTAFAIELPFDFDIDMGKRPAIMPTSTRINPRAMLLDIDPVVKGSVFVYDEYDSSITTSPTIARRMLYVAKSMPTSKHPGGGMVHFMLPFLDYDGTFTS